MDLQALKYPIGRFHKPEVFDEETVESLISTLEEFPKKINTLTEPLGIEELNWRYRPEGWTIKQVVHHCADSHMNSFVRFKWTLTENTPTIKAYEEADWAELSDSQVEDISDSLKFIEALHSKWIVLLRNLSPDELNKEFVHPDSGKKVNLKMNIAIYAWHCNHHLAHIEQALNFKNNFDG